MKVILLILRRVETWISLCICIYAYLSIRLDLIRGSARRRSQCRVGSHSNAYDIHLVTQMSSAPCGEHVQSNKNSTVH